MRDGHAVAQTGGAQAFAGEQAVGDQGTAETVQVLEQQAGFFESTLLAGGVDAHEHLSGRQDGRESVHVGAGRGRLCTHPAKHKGRLEGGPQE